MSGRKSPLKQFKLVSAGDMTDNIVAPVTNINFLDNIGFQFNWTGAAVGTFQIEISADYNQDTEGNVTNAGNWSPVRLTYLAAGVVTQENSVPTSSGSPIYVDLTEMSAPWIRARYVSESSSGSLDVWVTGKML